MAGTKDLLKIMQQAAQGANEASVPCNVVYGKVVSISPLAIKIKEGLTIPSSCLVLTRNVTDFTINVSLNWQTSTEPAHSHSFEGSTQANTGNVTAHTHDYNGITVASGEHNHTINSSGDNQITLHNALNIGDSVAMIKLQGGQSYLVLDRMVS